MSSTPSELVVAQIPTGHPDPSSTFRLQPLASPPTSATPGHLLLHSKFVSVDPYLRGVLRNAKVGEPLSSYTVAEVVDSQLDGYSKGDIVTGVLPWRTVQLSAGKEGSGQQLRKVSPPSGVPLSAYIGVLGMPGRTAYFGLLDHEVGRLQAGQTVMVSGAAGAVGSLVGQLAKWKGAKKVIGTAGGAEKCRLVKEKYGFDECIDYKQFDTVEKMREELKKAAPEGVNLYFDNVGGHVTQAMFEVYAKHGRMALCGAISSYNKSQQEDLVPNPLSAHSPRFTTTPQAPRILHSSRPLLCVR